MSDKPGHTLPIPEKQPQLPAPTRAGGTIQPTADELNGIIRDMSRRLETYEQYVADLRGQLAGLRSLVRSDAATSIRGFYRHFKGGIYMVLGVADGIDHQGPPLVIYESLQGFAEGKLQVRTLEDFTSTVACPDGKCPDGIHPRFVRVERWP